MIGKETDAIELHPGSVGHKLFPVLLRWVANRSCDNPKVLCASVRANVEEVAAVVDVVFVIGLARQNNFQVGSGATGRNVTRLARGLAGGFEKNNGLVA